MTDRCAVVGFGARTPVGLHVAAASAAVRAGISAQADHAFMLDRAAAPMLVCADALLDPGTELSDRLAAMATSAAIEAVQVLQDADAAPRELSLVLALPAHRPGCATSPGRGVEHALRQALAEERFRVRDAVWCEEGHASGVTALQEGVRRILGGQTDCCLVGGVDSYLAPETLEWLEAQELLRNELNRWGFCPGEAAGFCLLAAPNILARWNVQATLDIVATATAREPKPAGSGGVCIGEGLSRVFDAALSGLSDVQRVTHTLCDLNGEVWRADEYGFAMLRSSDRFAGGADFDAPADCWGDVGAASAPLLVGLAALGVGRPWNRGPRTLVVCSSQGDLRGALLLEERDFHRDGGRDAQ